MGNEAIANSKVVETRSIEMTFVEVSGVSVLDELAREFSVFTRCDVAEVIIDCTGMQCDDNEAERLYKVLGIQSDSELALQLKSNGYALFFA